MAPSVSILSILIAALVQYAYGQGNGVVRLFNQRLNNTLTTGIVQVYYQNQWGNICPDNGGRSLANTVCYQLGYNGAISYGDGTDGIYGDDNLDIILYAPSGCMSNDLTVLQCSHTTLGSCSNDSELTVRCYTTPVWDDPYKSELRLIGGNYVSEGRVEVYCDSWGTICSNGFTQNAANTICRQLGYTLASTYNAMSLPGNDNSPIWLENVDCSVSQNCLAYCQTCPSNAISSSSCSHSNDVTVQCTFDESYTSIAANTQTCVNAHLLASLSLGALIAVIVISIIVCCICIILAVTIPLCICCCLGVGIAAVSSRSGHSIRHTGLKV